MLSGGEMTRNIVHILHEGRPLCGFMPGVHPGKWPAGHLWVGVSDMKDATCDACFRVRPFVGAKLLAETAVADSSLRSE